MINLYYFLGTPCQIAALYKFLNKEYEKLCTVDVVCHGVPSNKVYKKYIEEMEKRYKQKVVNIKWRDKTKGWGPNHVTLYFEDGKSCTSISRENPFQTGFLDNVYLRPSCYNCAYAKLPRIGDISLADFWGYDGELKDKNNNKGISAVIISSEIGKKIFKDIEKDILYHEVSKEYLTSRSRHAHKPPKENKDREAFFRDFDKMSFKKISIKYHMKERKIIKILKKVKRKIIK